MPVEELKENEFRCEACNGIFVKDWSEAEAAKEAEENGFENEELAEVCDDCYKRIMSYNQS